MPFQMIDLKDYFQEIAKARKDQKISQERLAAMIGMNQAFISVIEKPGFADMILKIRRILKIGATEP